MSNFELYTKLPPPYEDWIITSRVVHYKYRVHLNLKNICKKEYKTVANARLILEIFLGRKLDKGEEAHHIDGDCTNDSPENLMPIKVKEHRQHHYIKYFDKEEICQGCGKKFISSVKSQINRAYRQKKTGALTQGLFCSGACVGKLTHSTSRKRK